MRGLSGLSGLNGESKLQGSAVSSLLTSSIAYWKLDEGSGTRVDSTGRGNDLNLASASAPGNTTGKVGSALTLVSASSQYVGIADNADMSTGDIDFTFAYWAKASSLGISIVASKWNDDLTQAEYLLGVLSSRWSFYVSRNGDGSSGATAAVANTFGAPSTGTWYFIVCWHDSIANTLNICVNNGTVDSVSYSLGVFDSTAGFKLGAYRSGGANGNWSGEIDEFGFWKRVLTAGERTSLYNSGNGITYPFVGT